MTGSRYPAPCRYEPAHGTFSGPSAMNAHYLAAHADVHVVKRPTAPSPYASSTSARRVRCRLCRSEMARGSFAKHLRTLHPTRRGEPAASLYEFVGSTGRAVARVEVEPRPRPAPPVVEQLPPIVADDIVQLTVEQLADPHGLMPVRHLPAVFAWRDATAAFLRSVRGEVES